MKILDEGTIERQKNNKIYRVHLLGFPNYRTGWNTAPNSLKHLNNYGYI